MQQSRRQRRILLAGHMFGVCVANLSLDYEVGADHEDTNDACCVLGDVGVCEYLGSDCPRVVQMR